MTRKGSAVRICHLPPSFAWSGALCGGCHAVAHSWRRRTFPLSTHLSKTTAWQAILRTLDFIKNWTQSSSKLMLWLEMPLDPQFYYVYILVSESDKDRHYSGFTTDLNARLKKHNNGEVSHTSKFRPWLIETAVRFRSKNKAHAFESYLKSGSGREFARRHF